MLHVVFAGPRHLHRRIHRFGYFHRFQDEVLFGPPAKATAQVRGVNSHLLGLEPRNLCSSHLREGLKLRRSKDVAAIRAHVCGAIHRFHGGMRQEGHFVNNFHFFGGSAERGICVAVFPRDGPGLLQTLAIEPTNRLARILGV